MLDLREMSSPASATGLQNRGVTGACCAGWKTQRLQLEM